MRCLTPSSPGKLSSNCFQIFIASSVLPGPLIKPAQLRGDVQKIVAGRFQVDGPLHGLGGIVVLAEQQQRLTVMIRCEGLSFRARLGFREGLCRRGFFAALQVAEVR